MKNENTKAVHDLIMLSPQAAAALLVGENHLTFIGAERIEEHLDFMGDLFALIPKSLLFRTQAKYQHFPASPPRILVNVTVATVHRSLSCSRPTPWRTVSRPQLSL